jgi:glycosyltransferase involved in cell wall biosynthesis
MKIVLPVHHFPPRHSAGAELYTFRLARWLIDRGHAVDVVTFDSIESGAPDALSVARDTHQGVPVWRLSMDLMRAPERRRWTFDNPLLSDWLRRLFADSKPDLVHFQAGYLIGMSAMRVARDAHVPALLTLHDYWFLCPRHTLLRGDGSLCEHIPANPAECVWCYEYMWEGRHRKLNQATLGVHRAITLRSMPAQKVQRMSDRRAGAAEALAAPRFVIAPSEYLGSRFAPWVDDQRLRVIRYGIDLEPFEVRPRPDPSPGQAMRIGYIGQIASHKGVHILIDAFQRLRGSTRPLELHIYGGLPEDSYVASLRKQAAGDARIQLQGRFDNARVAEILRGFDALAVPSIWYENMPLAILESYAAGTPVITSGTGGMAEPIHHERDGMLFKLGNAADLARTLQRLVDEPALLNTLQAGALGNRPYSIDEEMSRVFALYETALGAKQP